MTMDPRTALVIATLMMLLNGGVLGLMHRGLSADVQPSAVDWRIGTLLAAGGSVLLALQQFLPPGFILPAGNACLLIGVALYWRAVRRFDGDADSPWIFAPALFATAGVFWFSAVSPQLLMRVLFATVAWLIPLLSAATLLWRGRRRQPAISRSVLAGLMLVDALFMTLRALTYLFSANDPDSILDTSSAVNVLTPLVMAVLPVIGTTAFLMMCSERIRRQWEMAAATDYLTGLPNRRSITATGEARFNSAQRTNAGFAVAVVDIDHFKAINDRYGHDGGDRALKHVAAILEQQCRGPSMVGRQGGEEFVVLIEGAGATEAQAAAERLRMAVGLSPLQIEEAAVRITVSVGVSVLGKDDLAYDRLLQRADRALYAAKAEGRDRVILDAHASGAGEALESVPAATI
jgi:diguanylate cyclase (GGDEF)-like protein